MWISAEFKPNGSSTFYSGTLNLANADSARCLLTDGKYRVYLTYGGSTSATYSFRLKAEFDTLAESEAYVQRILHTVPEDYLV